MRSIFLHLPSRSDFSSRFIPYWSKKCNKFLLCDVNWNWCRKRWSFQFLVLFHFQHLQGKNNLIKCFWNVTQKNEKRKWTNVQMEQAQWEITLLNEAHQMIFDVPCDHPCSKFYMRTHFLQRISMSGLGNRDRMHYSPAVVCSDWLCLDLQDTIEWMHRVDTYCTYTSIKLLKLSTKK